MANNGSLSMVRRQNDDKLLCIVIPFGKKYSQNRRNFHLIPIP